MQIVSLFADIVGVAGAIFSLLAWLKAVKIKEELDKEKARQNKKVRIILQYGGSQAIELPVALRRAELARSEILGRLGMIPTKDSKRFSLAYLNNPDFLQLIDQISEGTTEGTLVIPCTDEEIRQFDFDKMKAEVKSKHG